MALLQISEPNNKNNKEKKFVAGIDLGTTNSIISKYEDNQFVIFKDNEQELIASCVNFDNGKITVGRQNNDDFKGIIISSIKRIMGKSLDQVSTYKNIVDLDFTQKNNMPALNIDNKYFTAIDLSSIILEHLKSVAEQSQNEVLTGAVITVPAYFDDVQRQATKTAAQNAGIQVMRLINEPTAAAIAYGLQSNSNGNFIVYDLGGGTFDISILSLEQGIFKVIATNGDTELGGDDIDAEIMNYLKIKHNLLDDISNYNLMKKCKILKESVNENKLESIETIDDQRIILTYEELEKLSLPLIKTTINMIKTTLKDSGLNENEINNIILVGGSTRLKLIKENLRESFEINILDDLNPDLIVSQGAAIQADILSGNSNEDLLLLDVLPLSLGIETYGDLVEKIIPRNTSIPSTATKTFTTFKDGQTRILIHVVQGERESVENCRSLGKFELSGLPQMIAGAPRVEVTFQIDADGILTVNAKEINSNINTSIDIRPSFGLSDTEIISMVDDANNSAESDLLIRKLSESKVEAERVIYALETALKEDGNELLNTEEYKKITIQLDKLKSILSDSKADNILTEIKNLEKISEFYVERRMNNSIKTLVEGKGVDDIL